MTEEDDDDLDEEELENVRLSFRHTLVCALKALTSLNKESLGCFS